MRDYDFFKDYKIQQGQFSLNTYSKADKFQIYAVKFIAELLLDDDYLLLSKFAVYKEFVANLFEFNIGDDVELREFLLNSLFHGNKDDNIVSKLISSANIEQITTETKNLLIEYSIKALESSVIITPAYITIIDRLILEFGLARSKYSKQLDHIDSAKEKRVVDKNFNMFKGLGQNDFLQVDNRPIKFSTDDTKKPKLGIKSFLPINNQKPKNTTDFNLKTTQSVENEKTRKLIARLIELNFMINSAELSKELDSIGRQLNDDTNRIVIVGEIKHGKSSLFNKILGQPLSPVGESTATTAAVIELFYSNKPKYEIKWMSSEGISKIMNYINDNDNNPHLSEYRYNFEDLVNKDYFKPDQVFNGVRSKSDLPNYMCSSGEFVSAVERVRIGNPIECLKHGAVLIDTPGLNDPIQVRTTITLNQALLADVLVFVMRADKLGLESERSFLEKIVRNGKISELIVVVTHIDLIENKTPQEKVRESVRDWLKKVPSKDAPQHMKSLMYEADIFVIDSREDISKKENKNVEFKQFIKKLSTPDESSAVTERYVTWIQDKRISLTELALSELEKFLNAGDDSKFNKILMDNLLDVISQLEDLSLHYEKQVMSKLDIICRKHKDDFFSLRQVIEKYKESAKLSMRNAIENKVQELDKKYSDNANWKSFHEDIVIGIIRTSAYELEKEGKRVLDGWGETIEEFEKELSEKFKATFCRFPQIRDEYEKVANTPAYIFSLCKVSSTFETLDRNIKRILLISSGAAGALAIVAFPVLVSLITAVPPVGLAVIGGTSLSYLAVKATGVLDKDKAKERFIQNKIDNVNKVIDQQFEIFDESIYNEFKKIEIALTDNISKLYAPILSATLASSRDIKYQIQVAQKMQDDIRRYANEVITMSKN